MPWHGGADASCLLVQETVRGDRRSPNQAPPHSPGSPSPRQSPPLFSNQPTAYTSKLKFAYFPWFIWMKRGDCESGKINNSSCKLCNKVLPAIQWTYNLPTTWLMFQNLFSLIVTTFVTWLGVLANHVQYHSGTITFQTSGFIEQQQWLGLTRYVLYKW